MATRARFNRPRSARAALRRLGNSIALAHVLLKEPICHGGPCGEGVSSSLACRDSSGPKCTTRRKDAFSGKGKVSVSRSVGRYTTQTGRLQTCGNRWPTSVSGQYPPVAQMLRSGRSKILAARKHLMFSIRLLPEDQVTDDGARIGEIVIDAFRERFACHQVDVPMERMESSWRRALQRLVDGEGEGAVALVHDPRFAWIVYRMDSQCAIQQKFSCTGEFGRIPPRRTQTESGENISEWRLDIGSIRRFLNSTPSS